MSRHPFTGSLIRSLLLGVVILVTGLKSFGLGLSRAGGAAIGLGWPVSALMSSCFTFAVAQ